MIRIPNFVEQYLTSDIKRGRVKKPHWFKCPIHSSPELEMLLVANPKGVIYGHAVLGLWERIQKWCVLHWKRAGQFILADGSAMTVDQIAISLNMGGETEFLLDNRHLYLRTGRMTTMLKLRSTLFGAIHSYFRDRDFTEYHAPNFVAGAVEGGSTLFEVPYFGRKAYLTQSWQLYAEAAMPALERLYTIAPSFRAEKSRTRRHLTEYWHAEMEVAWASNADIMEYGEGVVRHIARTLLDESSDELSELGRDLELIASYADSAYPRMRYDEAIETLQGKGVSVEWGQDLDYSKEKVLTADFDVPHFITHYPRIAKPFYHRPDPDEPKYVLCHDLLAPEGYGEIIGGGERTWSEKEILERIDEEGTPREPYEFYIDIRRYGGVPHGGFGLGVDRVCAWLSGADLIREVIPFPRDSRRVTP